MRSGKHIDVTSASQLETLAQFQVNQNALGTKAGTVFAE